MATILVGLAALMVKPIQRRFKGKKPCWVSRDCIIDFLNGCALVPFFVLIMAVGSKAFLQEALNTNKVSLAISGMIGLIFVVKEIIMEPPNGNATPLGMNTIGNSTTGTDPPR